MCITLAPGTFLEVSDYRFAVSLPRISDILCAEQPIGGYPEDLDTTSIGLTVAQPEDHTVDSVMDDMLRYTTEDGIIMVKTPIPDTRNPAKPSSGRPTLTQSGHAQIPLSVSTS
jgi:hypothetical protein